MCIYIYIHPHVSLILSKTISSFTKKSNHTPQPPWCLFAMCAFLRTLISLLPHGRLCVWKMVTRGFIVDAWIYLDTYCIPVSKRFAYDYICSYFPHKSNQYMCIYIIWKISTMLLLYILMHTYTFIYVQWTVASANASIYNVCWDDINLTSSWNKSYIISIASSNRFSPSPVSH